MILLSKANPCHGCDKRHATCHSTCPDYLDWREEKQAEAKKIQKAKDIHLRLTNAEIDRYRKHKKKNKRRFVR
jgi:hypothetical protein